MIKFNVRHQFNFLNIFNENVKVFSKQAHSYFDDQIKNIDILISESQDWLSQKRTLKLNFDFLNSINLNKNIRELSKQAHSYFDNRMHLISEKLDVSNILTLNKNIMSISKTACSYVDDHIKSMDIFISEKHSWLIQKRVEFTQIIKESTSLNDKKIILIDNKHAGFILEKLDHFSFVNNNSKISSVFLIKLIGKLVELIKLSRLISFFKKKFYSLELVNIRIVRAPPVSSFQK